MTAATVDVVLSQKLQKSTLTMCGLVVNRLVMKSANRHEKEEAAIKVIAASYLANCKLRRSGHLHQAVGDPVVPGRIAEANQEKVSPLLHIVELKRDALRQRVENAVVRKQFLPIAAV